MLDSTYHMTLKLLKYRMKIGVKTLRFCHILRNPIIEVIMLRH